MLEEGELDDDLDVIQPAVASSPSLSPSASSTSSEAAADLAQVSRKHSLLPTPRQPLLIEPLHGIPALLPSNIADKKGKRKNQPHDKSSKLKKLKNNEENNRHHHHHRHHHRKNHRKEEDMEEADEPGEEEEEETNGGGGQDQDERLGAAMFDASANFFKATGKSSSSKNNSNNKTPLLATPAWAPPAKQAPVSLLDLFKDTNPSEVNGASVVSSRYVHVDTLSFIHI